jgi:hypothetical protein
MPVDSYVLDYQTTEEKYFAGTMYEVSMVIKTIDYTSRENQDAVMKLQQDLQQSEFVHGVVDCWLKDFIEWLPRSPMNISLVDGRPENGTPRNPYQFAFQLAHPNLRGVILPIILHLDGNSRPRALAKYRVPEWIHQIQSHVIAPPVNGLRYR